MIAFLFPGQGSQRPGMGKPWVDVWPDLFEVASDVSGKNVRSLVCDADEEELKATDNAQLATAVVSLAAHRALTDAGVSPSVVAGHSLGEYTALIATGAVDVEEGLRLIAARGDGMAEAAVRHHGTMAALIGASLEMAEEVCCKAGGTVVVGNHNSDSQVVISGTHDAIERAVEIAKQLGVRKTIPLKVGGAFHSPLMAPALPQLATALARTPVQSPAVPVICNVDGRVHYVADGLVPLLLAQLCSPVLWADTMSTLDRMGARAFVEIGPGGVLYRLAKRAVKGALHAAVENPADARVVAEALAGIQPSLSFVAHAVDDVLDRLIIAPAPGRFQPAPPCSYTVEGEFVSVGDVVGEVLTENGAIPVTAGISGWVMNLIAQNDETVERGQPLLAVRPF